MTTSDLTPHERRLLDALRGADGLAGHDELLEVMLRDGLRLDSDKRMLKVYIYRLRRKGYQIVNVRGAGYALAPYTRCHACGRPLERPQ